MTRNRATIEATGNTVRGPWESSRCGRRCRSPSSPLILALSSARTRWLSPARMPTRSWRRARPVATVLASPPAERLPSSRCRNLRVVEFQPPRCNDPCSCRRPRRSAQAGVPLPAPFRAARWRCRRAHARYQPAGRRSAGHEPHARHGADARHGAKCLAGSRL